MKTMGLWTDHTKIATRFSRHLLTVPRTPRPWSIQSTLVWTF